MDLRRHNQQSSPTTGALPRFRSKFEFAGTTFEWRSTELMPYPTTGQVGEKLIDRNQPLVPGANIRYVIRHHARVFNLSVEADCEVYSRLAEGAKYGWVTVVDRERWRDGDKLSLYLEFILGYFDLA